MDIQINFPPTSLTQSVLNLYNCILEEKLNPSASETLNIQVPDGNEFLKMIENLFNELHNPEVLVSLLKTLHLIIQQSTFSTCQQMANSIQTILTKHRLNDQDYLIALKLLKQFLTSLPEDFPIEKKLADELLHSSDNPRVQNQLALCTCLLIDKFKLNSLLEVIWKDILKKQSSSLLVHYADFLISKHHVYRSVEFWQLIEKFLLVESNRKMAVFVIHRVLQFLSTNKKRVEIKNYFFWSGRLETDLWLTYLIILNNLEEKQSHLILPSLEMLKNINLGENTPWMRIVLQIMLRHKNKLVLRWSVKYLFLHFSRLVLQNTILEDFLHATNNSWLCNDVNLIQIPSFELNEREYFMEVFASIPWKSIPMHRWLMEMKEDDVWKNVNCQAVTKAATKVRQLQNRVIRSNCRNAICDIFKHQIKRMDLFGFIKFLDAMYSGSNKVCPELLNLLMDKIEKAGELYLSFNMFSILRKQKLCSNHQEILLGKLRSIPSGEHKWFSVLVMFYFDNTESKINFCQEYYKIDLKDDMSLQEAKSEFVVSLGWDEVSRAVVREITVDRYTEKCQKIDENDFEIFLNTGGTATLINITNPERRNFVLNVAMFKCLLAELKILSKRVVDIANIVKYIIVSCKHDQPNLFYKYINEILDIDVTNNRLALGVYKASVELCDLNEEESRKFLIRGLLFGEPLSGDARLDYDYAVAVDLDCESSYEIRETCLNFVRGLDPDVLIHLKSDLIRQSKLMSIKKPRYFENSKHHRIKLRIAQTLAIISNKCSAWDDYYLYAILQENNQINVTYIYELIVAKTITESKLMNQMVNLNNLSNSCKSSLFAISFLFCVHHKCETEFVSKLVRHLLPWTMGSNFNTRLYAQIAVFHLIDKFKVNMYSFLKSDIEQVLRGSSNAIDKLYTDIRFNFDFDLNSLNVDPILYATDVPEDERLSSSLFYLNENSVLKKLRRLQFLKRDSTKENEAEVVFEDVQRKANPEIDLTDEVVNTEMVVVASLIDKLPNLGGIARTCEVLGIKELVLDSIIHTKNKLFKDLSMTAENWINVTEVKPKDLKEFLNSKSIEGYAIVGAEQTSKSVNFMDFQFPKKCILLLGHEKEGIPADLIAFLDYTVEIPQFGMVRSLNVHVTGALFMYEYCKQHLKNLKM